MEGWQKHDEQKWQRAAQTAAWIMGPWVKGRVTADDLLGKSTTESVIIPGTGATAEDVWRKVRRARENKK